MNDSIEKSIKFLSDQYDKNVSYINNKEAKEYRFEHSIRVANIGIEIAKKEGLDVETLALGCILHDVSYMNEFKIDRFDTYRIYETLEYIKFSKMNLEEKIEHVDKVLKKLNKYIDMELATKTATEMWREKIDFQLEFYRRLGIQLRNSNEIDVLYRFN